MTGFATALLALLGTVFTASAYGKVRSTTAWRTFRSSLRPLGLVPGRLIRPVAGALLAAETILAIASGWAVLGGLANLPGTAPAGRVAAVGAVLVLAVLTAGVAIALARRTDASCACFGTSSRPLGRLHLVRNAGLLACSVLATIELLPVHARASTGGLAVGAAAGVIGALLIIRLDDLAELFFPAPA